jgi:hypothetical protein
MGWLQDLRPEVVDNVVIFIFDLFNRAPITSRAPAKYRGYPAHSHRYAPPDQRQLQLASDGFSSDHQWTVGMFDLMDWYFII